MFKTILVGVIVLVVALAGILTWHTIETNQIKARMAEIEQEVANRKKVMVDIAVAPPANTPKDQVLYVSGSVPSLGNWDAAGVALKPGEDGKHHAQVEVLTGLEYAFKVTRGTWGTVEADPGGKDIGNLVGVGRINMRRETFTPSRLWVANLATKKFVPLKLTGIRCIFSAP